MQTPFKSIGEFMTNLVPSNSSSYEAPATPKTYTVRGVQVTDQDLDTARKIAFGEISNRNSAKQNMEASVILNTALNRVPQYQANGQKVSLHDVLTMPNQYQAYNGSEYKRLESGTTTTVDAPKLKAIDDTIAKIKTGNFPDTTGGKVFYSHDKAGQIWLKDGTLFKQPRNFNNLSK